MLSFAAPTWQTAVLSRNPRGALGSGKARTASLIVPRLYLSDYFTARDEKQLSKLGITHIISILDRVPTIPECIPENHTLHISIADRADADILQYLDQTTDFITTALAENEENNVLVHCFQGVSRSATAVCAYLVATTSMTAPESIAYVQAKRSVVCPNLGFRNQLQTWSAKFYADSAKRSGSRVSKITGSIAELVRELKAATGAPPSPAKRPKLAAE
ncbi:protein-tyrosine phosphatase-like protein [Mycena belliarum]|uniref:Protein-tyrosine phosphatase-like protein n=1 Tax=Mycena belliarum TaxID=1033014 RepID=A0AAD6U562_9AGAR|nr:protein-tyrosine phosphatase-like protein [Mycena belliae]